MYDRKTWIILALCGVLIALNMHFAAKNEAYKRANQPASGKIGSTSLSDGNPATPEAGLSVETPPPPTSEETRRP